MKRVNSNLKKGMRQFYLIISIQIFACMVLAQPSSVNAAEFNVSSGDTAGLIDAINDANGNGEDDTINLEGGTYTLVSVDNDTDGSNGLPSITSKITIRGAGAAVTTVERDAAGSTPLFRIFHVASDGDLSLEDVTVSGGSEWKGAGIFNNGTLTLTNSTVSENNGGGIYNAGDAILYDCNILRNLANIWGGGIHNQGNLTVNNCTFLDNNGGADGAGAIYNSGYLTANNCTFSNNEGAPGGAIVNNCAAQYSGPGIAILNNCTISGNKGFAEGGGILNCGNLTLNNCTISDNGPIYPDAYLLGGGIFNAGTAELRNTIIANNEYDNCETIDLTCDLTWGYWDVSGIEPGTIWDGSKLVFQTQTPQGSDYEVTGYFDWISEGLFYGTEIFQGTFSSDLSLHLVGTEHVNKPPWSGIWLAIYDAVVSPDCNHIFNGTWSDRGMPPFGTWSAKNVFRTITSRGHNLEDANTCGFDGPGDLVNTDALLGPLTNNGGPTLTHALLEGSPAIDAGDNENCPETDQRGVQRPIDGDEDGTATCDIGAYEFDPTPPDTIPPTCNAYLTEPVDPYELRGVIEIQDTGSGLAKIEPVTAINADLTIPIFSEGTTDQVNVVADGYSGWRVSVKAIDVAGNYRICDPAVVKLEIEKGRKDKEKVKKVPAADYIVTIMNNENSGLKKVVVKVNGCKFVERDMDNGETREINISSCMHEGRNKIVLKGRGREGSSATVAIHDGTFQF